MAPTSKDRLESILLRLSEAKSYKSELERMSDETRKAMKTLESVRKSLERLNKEIGKPKRDMKKIAAQGVNPYQPYSLSRDAAARIGRAHAEADEALDNINALLLKSGLVDW